MSEREITFSQKEKDQMGFYALQFAGFGEDDIWELVLAKAQMIKMTLDWQDSPQLKALFPERERMLHEIDVLNEVIRQAKTTMQFEGKDDLSILNQKAQSVGLGSVFDPDSQIGKKMMDLLGR